MHRRKALADQDSLERKVQLIQEGITDEQAEAIKKVAGLESHLKELINNLHIQVDSVLPSNVYEESRVTIIRREFATATQKKLEDLIDQIMKVFMQDDYLDLIENSKDSAIAKSHQIIFSSLEKRLNELNDKVKALPTSENNKEWRDDIETVKDFIAKQCIKFQATPHTLNEITNCELALQLDKAANQFLTEWQIRKIPESESGRIFGMFAKLSQWNAQAKWKELINTLHKSPSEVKKPDNNPYELLHKKYQNLRVALEAVDQYYEIFPEKIKKYVEEVIKDLKGEISFISKEISSTKDISDEDQTRQIAIALFAHIIRYCDDISAKSSKKAEHKFS